MTLVFSQFIHFQWWQILTSTTSGGTADQNKIFKQYIYYLLNSMLIFRHAVDVILHWCYSFAVVNVNISWGLNCRRCLSFAAVDVNIFVVSDRPVLNECFYHFFVCFNVNLFFMNALKRIRKNLCRRKARTLVFTSRVNFFTSKSGRWWSFLDVRSFTILRRWLKTDSSSATCRHTVIRSFVINYAKNL